MRFQQFWARILHLHRTLVGEEENHTCVGFPVSGNVVAGFFLQGAWRNHSSATTSATAGVTAGATAGAACRRTCGLSSIYCSFKGQKSRLPALERFCSHCETLTSVDWLFWEFSMQTCFGLSQGLYTSLWTWTELSLFTLKWRHFSDTIFHCVLPAFGSWYNRS